MPLDEKTTKADRTRVRLITSAKRLIRERGTDDFALRDLAATARMKAGSIYYHFQSREEIIRTVLEDSMRVAREAVLTAIAEAGPQASPLTRLRTALASHVRCIVQDHLVARLELIRRLPPRLRRYHMNQEREYAAIFTGLLVETQEQGMVRSEVNLSVVRMLCMGALNWVAEWYDSGGPMSLDDITDELIAILSNGIVERANKWK